MAQQRPHTLSADCPRRERGAEVSNGAHYRSVLSLRDGDDIEECTLDCYFVFNYGLYLFEGRRVVRSQSQTVVKPLCNRL